MDPHVAFPLQLALVLVLARLLGEGMRSLNQPPVLGELLAGVCLGPSLFGWIWPQGFEAVFAGVNGARPGLDAISDLGLILLMLLTGLETDIRVMLNLGKAAFMASFFGLVVPFASGLGLGFFLDASFEPAIGGRLVLCLFLATAMAVSAMPVIAKILIDLGLMKRNFATLALSAAVVDDTVGWIVLAVIVGMATGGTVEVSTVFGTLGWLALFCLGACILLYPAIKWLLPRMEHLLLLPGGQLVFLVAVALLCGAATASMHVHAVFGAFVAGLIFRQCSSLSREALHRLEETVFAVFAPVFFGAIGLQVDLGALGGMGLTAIVVALAIFGKIAGCYIGGALGRLAPAESLALGLAMTARGAVGLVVAKIGLDNEILNPELFAALVLMAILTTFFAPLALRFLAPHIPVSEEERLREKVVEGRLLPASGLKVLVPTAGGENAALGCQMANRLCRSESDRCVVLYVEGEARSWWRRLWRGAAARAEQIEIFFDRARKAPGAQSGRMALRRIPPAGGVGETIVAEAAKGYHLLVLGASRHGHPVYDPFISSVVRKSPCHVMLVAGAVRDPKDACNRILVAVNGTYVSDAAFAVAAAYAEAVGASIDLLFLFEGRERNPLLPGAGVEPVGENMQQVMRVTLKEQYLDRFNYPERLECHVHESESLFSGLAEAVPRLKNDLVVLGAENRSLVEHLYLGANIEDALNDSPCPVAIVIPKMGNA